MAGVFVISIFLLFATVPIILISFVQKLLCLENKVIRYIPLVADLCFYAWGVVIKDGEFNAPVAVIFFFGIVLGWIMYFRESAKTKKNKEKNEE